jgi:hypothetical protein
VQTRHFIVHKVDGFYALKEIVTEVAKSVAHYGVSITEYRCKQSECWYFYFITQPPPPKDDRDDIIEQLVEQVSA